SMYPNSAHRPAQSRRPGNSSSGGPSPADRQWTRKPPTSTNLVSNPQAPLRTRQARESCRGIVHRLTDDDERPSHQAVTGEAPSRSRWWSTVDRNVRSGTNWVTALGSLRTDGTASLTLSTDRKSTRLNSSHVK